MAEGLFQRTSLDRRLANLQRDQRSIGTFAAWLGFYQSEADQVAKALCDTMVAAAHDQNKDLCLNLLFVVHELLLLSRRNPSGFAKVFSDHLPTTLDRCIASLSGGSGELQCELLNLVGIWKELGVFPASVTEAVVRSARRQASGSVVLSSTSRFPELVQVSKRLLEACDAQTKADDTLKRRKLASGQESKEVLQHHVSNMQNAVAAQEKLRECVTDLIGRLDDELQMIRQRTSTMKEMNTKITALRKRAEEAEGVVRETESPRGARDASPGATIPQWLVKGARVMYKGRDGERKATIVVVDRTISPPAFQVKLDNGVERSTEASHLRKLTKAEEAEDSINKSITAGSGVFQGLERLFAMEAGGTNGVTAAAAAPDAPPSSSPVQPTSTWSNALEGAVNAIADVFSESTNTSAPA